MTWIRANAYDPWHAQDATGLALCGRNPAGNPLPPETCDTDPLSGTHCTWCVRNLLADLRQRLAEAEQDRDEGAAALVKVTQERDEARGERDSLDQDLADKEAGERWHNGPRDPEPV